MNKNHRVIWNEVRQCFVVASEKTKTRGKPSTTRKTIASAVAALLLAPGMAAAVCDGTTPLSGTVFDTQCYWNESAEVLGGGSIIHLDTAHALGIIATDASLDNAGLVQAIATPVGFNPGPGIAADALGIRFTSGLAGSLNNAGAINAVVTDHFANAVDATGVLIEGGEDGVLGDLSGSLTNSNLINATATSDDVGEDASLGPWASANGLVAGNLTDSGVLDNSGTIGTQAKAQGVYAAAYAHGVSLVGMRSEGAQATYEESFTSHTVFSGGDLAGSMSNTGTIQAEAQATGVDSATAAAYGIDIDGNLSGALSNEGTIAATATASGTEEAYAAAYGILARNNPEIWSSYTSSWSGNPTGILSGSLTNAGTISAVADAVGERAYARAYGVHFEGGIAANGELINDGTIDATASATGEDVGSYAVAVFLGGGEDDAGGLAGSLVNNDLIHAQATADGLDYAEAYAAGIVVIGEDGFIPASFSITEAGEPGLTNNGTIEVRANATASGGEDGDYSARAFAEGIGGSGLFVPLTNTGLIDVQATATLAEASGSTSDASASAYAAGIYWGGLGSLDNSGDILVSATADASDYAYAYAYAYARAYGIAAGYVVEGASLTNSGEISATATATAEGAYAEAYAAAYGMTLGYVGEDASLTNSGDIMATATATANGEDAAAFAGAAAYAISYMGDNTSLTNSGELSATATATAEGAYAGAYATAFGMRLGYVGEDVSWTNSGEIGATATATGADAYAYAYAAGVYVNYDLAGTWTNSGEIGATATATATGEDAYAAAYGIYVDDNLSGTLTNGGKISAAATATTEGEDAYAAAYAHGIYSEDDLTGTLTNNNEISATATATGGEYAYAYAYGIHLDDDMRGALTNAGKIVATAMATGEDAYAAAYGIYVDDNLSGTLTNGGKISAAATATAEGEDAYATAYAYAHGIYSEDDLTGTLTNNNEVSATATATGGEYAYAYAYGIHLDDDMRGALTNAGKIVATAMATGEEAYAGAYGIHIVDDVDGSLTNSGQIGATATATGEYAYASAYGIDIDAMTNMSTLTNGSSGEISATATATGDEQAYASAYGIAIAYMYPGTSLTNSGQINAAATAESAYAYAYAYALGMRIGNMNSASLTNSGEIGATAAVTANGEDAAATAVGVYVGSMGYSGEDTTLTNSKSGVISATATASGEDAYALAYGVQIGYLGEDATLTNSGTISATATADGSMYAAAYGVYVSDLEGSLTNSGTISGTADDPYYGYSIYAENGSGTIDNLAGGVLKGNLYVGGGVAVNNAGLISMPAGAHGYINSDYTQQTGGVLEIGTVSAGEDGYATLDVRGTADLSASSTIAVRVKPINTLDKGDKLNNVVNAPSAEGRLVLAKGNAEEGDKVEVIGTPLFTYRGEVDAHNNIDIYIDDEGTFAEVLGAQGDPSIAGIGSTLDELNGQYGEDGKLDDLIDALYGLNSVGELNQAAQSLTPLIASHVGQATQGVMNDVNRIIQARQDDNRGLSSGEQFYGDRNFWFKPFGSRADQKQRGGVSGYRAKSYGLAFGADAVVSDATRIGAAFTYANSDVDTKSVVRQWGDVDSYQLAFYGSHSLDERTDVNFQVDFGHHKNDVGRNILVPTPAVAKGSFNAWSGHVGGGIGRTYALDASTTITPSFRADYSYLRTKGYTETGAGLLNLAVNGFKVDELVLAVDGKLNRDLGGGTSFVANLGLGYDALADRTSITSAFVGGGSAFATQGIDPSKWLVRGGLGLVMKKDKSYEVTARYDAEGRSKYTNQTASVKVRIPF